MEHFEEQTIRQYLRLKQKEKSLIHKKERFRAERYQSNFCSHVVYGDLGIYSESITPPMFAEQLDRFNRIVDKRIEVNQFRKKYWDKFMDSLEKVERDYLVARFIKGYEVDDEQVNEKVLDEIEEINTAINLWLGIEDEDTTDLGLVEGSYFDNMDAILELMECD